METGDFLGQVGGPLAGAGGLLGGLGAGLTAFKENCETSPGTDCIYASWPASMFVDMDPAAAMALGSTLGASVGIVLTLGVLVYKATSGSGD